MNSEELEKSLRSEFENYLKTVVAGMRQETTEFQNRLHAQFDEAFQGFVGRFDSGHQFDEAFRGSVAEHLRLARDEGARITADAMAEAEKLNVPAAPAEVKYDAIRDAVADICSKDSQSSILKSLVSHAAEFAPRGAFFIIKSDHLVGWKVFGAQPEAENAIRDIHFPVANDTILGGAVRSLEASNGSMGSHSGDAAFLDPLEFGQPERMYAIPLVARGRGVAVLYVDHGTDGAPVNREALETLVRVAGLTVELIASMQTAQTEQRAVGAADFEDTSHDEAATAPEPRFDETFREQSFDAPAPVVAEGSEHSGFAFGESGSFDSGSTPEPAASYETQNYEQAPTPFDVPYAADDAVIDVQEVSGSNEFDSPFAQPSAPEFDQTQPVQFEATTYSPAEPSPVTEAVFESGGSIESAEFQKSPFDQAAQAFEPAVTNPGGFNQVAETVAEVPAVQSQPQVRYSDRPVDLPIEVPDDERRIHNDARRFARLLVSEIKLYNEKKVVEGREASDLYERLREAIDRSREMYDKRIQTPVASKFDYFHYELVNSLADGDDARLGADYPGSRV